MSITTTTTITTIPISPNPFALTLTDGLINIKNNCFVNAPLNALFLTNNFTFTQLLEVSRNTQGGYLETTFPFSRITWSALQKALIADIDSYKTRVAFRTAKNYWSTSTSTSLAPASTTFRLFDHTLFLTNQIETLIIKIKNTNYTSLTEFTNDWTPLLSSIMTTEQIQKSTSLFFSRLQPLWVERINMVKNTGLEKCATPLSCSLDTLRDYLAVIEKESKSVNRAIDFLFNKEIEDIRQQYIEPVEWLDTNYSTVTTFRQELELCSGGDYINTLKLILNNIFHLPSYCFYQLDFSFETFNILHILESLNDYTTTTSTSGAINGSSLPVFCFCLWETTECKDIFLSTAECNLTFKEIFAGVLTNSAPINLSIDSDTNTPLICNSIIIGLAIGEEIGHVYSLVREEYSGLWFLVDDMIQGHILIETPYDQKHFDYLESFAQMYNQSRTIISATFIYSMSIADIQSNYNNIYSELMLMPSLEVVAESIYNLILNKYLDSTTTAIYEVYSYHYLEKLYSIFQELLLDSTKVKADSELMLMPILSITAKLSAQVSQLSKWCLDDQKKLIPIDQHLDSVVEKAPFPSHQHFFQYLSYSSCEALAIRIAMVSLTRGVQAAANEFCMLYCNLYPSTLQLRIASRL